MVTSFRHESCLSTCTETPKTHFYAQLEVEASGFTCINRTRGFLFRTFLVIKDYVGWLARKSTRHFSLYDLKPVLYVVSSLSQVGVRRYVFVRFDSEFPST